MRMRKKKHLDERIAKRNNLYVLESVEFYKKKDKFPDYLDYKTLFGNDNPVEMEIGCGKGKFIVEHAKKNPDVNYIAVEKLSNVIVSAAELADGLKNLVFLNLSAENLEFFIKNDSIRKIYLNFSCPYPKHTYANRRLTNPKFLKIYKNILSNGGFIRQKTDNVPFFEYSIECFKEFGYNITELTYDLHNAPNDEITTEYEDKFIINNFKICALTAYPPSK